MVNQNPGMVGSDQTDGWSSQAIDKCTTCHDISVRERLHRVGELFTSVGHNTD